MKIPCNNKYCGARINGKCNFMEWESLVKQCRRRLQNELSELMWWVVFVNETTWQEKRKCFEFKYELWDAFWIKEDSFMDGIKERIIEVVHMLHGMEEK